MGHYGNFDRLAAEALVRAKGRYPYIRVRLLLPYHPFDCPIPVPPGFDDTYYPEGLETVPKRPAIVRANRYMAAHSGFLIAYVWRPASSARDLLDYAKARGTVQVENLAEQTNP